MNTKKQDLEVLEEAVAGVYVRNAECRLEPLVGNVYYVYLREDGTSFISLVEPEFWDTQRFKLKYITKAVYNNSSWCEIPD
tara:strand:- start:54 stop:296 length:243 start_codon:yes stop_codon:yes gene_type:complete